MTKIALISKKNILFLGILSYCFIFSAIAEDKKESNPYDSIQKLKYLVEVNIVDEKGAPLTDVKVEIIKSKVTGGTLFTPEGTDEKKNIVLTSSNKTFDFTGYVSGRLTFSKKGFFKIKKSIDKFSLEKSRKTFTRAKIILRKMSQLPEEELEIREMTLSYKKSEEGIIKKGWSYKKDKLGYIPDSVIYKKPEEVLLYVARDKKDKKKLYLISNSKETGFILQSSAKNLTYLTIAPEEGYKQKIAMKVNLLNGNKNTFYCFFKLNNQYGKAQIYANLTDRSLNEDYSKEKDGTYIIYDLSIEYFLNPSGKRNVTTNEE